MSKPAADHPATVLDDLVHQRTRLGILTVLAEAGRSEFTYVRDVLGLSDGNLGRHLELLADATLIEIEKGYEDRRPRTWMEITPAGASALAAYIENLKAIVDRVENSDVLPHVPPVRPAQA